MCLTRIYRGNEKKAVLAELPEIGYYWKTFTVRQNKHYQNKYFPITQRLPYGKPFKDGWNQCSNNYIGEGYNVAFHLHKTRKDAETWLGKTVRCKVEKKDIVAVGTQFSEFVIVTTRIWIPKPN